MEISAGARAGGCVVDPGQQPLSRHQRRCVKLSTPPTSLPPTHTQQRYRLIILAACHQHSPPCCFVKRLDWCHLVRVALEEQEQECWTAVPGRQKPPVCARLVAAFSFSSAFRFQKALVCVHQGLRLRSLFAVDSLFLRWNFEKCSGFQSVAEISLGFKVRRISFPLRVFRRTSVLDSRCLFGSPFLANFRFSQRGQISVDSSVDDASLPSQECSSVSCPFFYLPLWHMVSRSEQLDGGFGVNPSWKLFRLIGFRQYLLKVPNSFLLFCYRNKCAVNFLLQKERSNVLLSSFRLYNNIPVFLCILQLNCK